MGNCNSAVEKGVKLMGCVCADLRCREPADPTSAEHNHDPLPVLSKSLHLAAVLNSE